MKRIRKFRHYFPSTKVLTAGMGVMTFITFSSGLEDYWKECIWMDFIGSCDKDGVEIYEGDIVETRYGKIIVEWDVVCCGYSPFANDFRFFADNSKVIGNVFQTPDLIYPNQLKNYLERQNITI